MLTPDEPGWLKIRLHRPLPQGFQLKNILLTRKCDDWYATIALFDPTVPTFNLDDVVPTWDNSLGMDAVLLEDDYLATSQHTKLPSVKSCSKNQKRLASVSKRKAAKRKGSKSRRKLALSEGRQHQRIARKYEAIAKSQNWKCPVCGDTLFNGEPIETHHIVPVAQGGSDDAENLKHLHSPCHKPYIPHFKMSYFNTSINLTKNYYSD